MNRSFQPAELGEGLDGAEIVAWHVSAGDHVVAGQPLVSAETGGAMVRVPAPCSGRIAVLHGNPGERLHAGEVLVEIADTNEDLGAVVGKLPDAAQPPTDKESNP